MNKSKRKRTPSRRRKFLLMIVLPIVALMVGFVALSPQIDTWLATDPFTPQCQFEQDRVFATGDPTIVTSINEGQYDSGLKSYTSSPNFNEIKWSPNGKYLISLQRNGQIRKAVLWTSEGEHLYTFSNSEYEFDWSPDNQYIAYRKDKDNQAGNYVTRLFDVETLSTLPDVEFIIGEYSALWSPDGRYLPRAWEFGGGGNYWFISDFEDNMREYEPFDDWLNGKSSYAIGWSNDSQDVYFERENMLYKYHVQNDRLTELLIIPPSYRVSLSPDLTKAIIWDREEGKAIVSNLKTLEETDISITGIIGSPIWFPDSKQIAINLIRDEDKELWIYNLTNNESHLISLSSSTSLSPSGKYVLNSIDDGTLRERNLYASKYKTGVYGKYEIMTVDTLEVTPLGLFDNYYILRWLHHDGKDYLVTQQAMDTDREKPLLTYIIDPQDNSRCKIGWTGYELEFQPEGQN